MDHFLLCREVPDFGPNATVPHHSHLRRYPRRRRHRGRRCRYSLGRRRRRRLRSAGDAVDFGQRGGSDDVDGDRRGRVVGPALGGGHVADRLVATGRPKVYFSDLS